MLLLTAIKCNRVRCRQPLCGFSFCFVFYKSSGDFHRIKMTLSFGVVISEKEKGRIENYTKIPRRRSSNKLEDEESKIVSWLWNRCARLWRWGWKCLRARVDKRSPTKLPWLHRAPSQSKFCFFSCGELPLHDRSPERRRQSPLRGLCAMEPPTALDISPFTKASLALRFI